MAGRGVRAKLNCAAVTAFLVTAFLGLAGSTRAMGSLPGNQETRRSVPATQTEPRDAHLVTFVELGSVRCIPCKMMQPIMAEIEKEYGPQVKVVFHDVWTPEGQPYAAKYRIQAIPTQVFLDREGKEFFRHMGFYPKEEIVKVLQTQGVK